MHVASRNAFEASAKKRLFWLCPAKIFTLLMKHNQVAHAAHCKVAMHKKHEKNPIVLSLFFAIRCKELASQSNFMDRLLLLNKFDIILVTEWQQRTVWEPRNRRHFF